MNFKQYDTKRRELLHQLARGDEDKEIIFGELRILKNQYECDCKHCVEDLPYECRKVNGYNHSPQQDLPNSPVCPSSLRSGDTHNLESEVRK